MKRYIRKGEERMRRGRGSKDKSRQEIKTFGIHQLIDGKGSHRSALDGSKAKRCGPRERVRK